MSTRIGRAGDDDDIDATLPAPPSNPAPTKSDYTGLVAVDPAHYAIDGEMARGGMGRILRARDRRLGREVALKELANAAESDLRVRFEREARITARLQHPGIVPILEAGTWPTGEPFYAMKLVAGDSLDKVIAKCTTVEQRLGLVPSVIAAVDALAYAHHERVIHRDLKPANVLVGTFGETIVIDWGLAKDLDSDAGDSLQVGPYRGSAGAPGETVAGSIMGTPQYMPPEQARGEPVDPRADVYALGAMLYHVLAGRPPYHGMPVQVVLAAVVSEPPSPIDPAGIPPELLTIVDKAMAQRADDRYRDAGELAADLKKFQTGQLVGAHRYTWGELARRWLRRYRAPVTVGAIAVLALAVIGGVSIWRVIDERDRADAANADAVVARDQALVGQRAAVDSAGQALLARSQAALERDPAEALAWLRQLAVVAASPGNLAAARVIAADAMSRHPADDVWAGHAQFPVGVAVSIDGSRVASWDRATLRVWSRDAPPIVESWRTIAGAHWCDDGRLIATRPSEVYTLDPATGAVTYDAGWQTGRIAATCSAADRTFSTRARRDHVIGGEIVHYDAATNTSTEVPDAEAFLAATADGEHQLYALAGQLESRTASGKVIARVPFANADGLYAASADGSVLATWGPGGATYATATTPARPIPEFQNNEQIAVSPDGHYLAQASQQGLHRLDVRTPEAASLFPIEDAGLSARLAFSPDSRWLAIQGDEALRIYDVALPLSSVLTTVPVAAFAFSPDSKMLAAAGRDRTVRRWTLGAQPRSIRPVGGELAFAAALSDGGIVLADATVHLEGGTQLDAGPTRVAAVSPAGDAVAWVDGHARVRRYRVGHDVETLGAVTASVSGLALAGDLVVAWDRRGTVTALRSGAEPRNIAIAPGAAEPETARPPHANLARNAAPLPAGHTPATGADARIVLHDASLVILGNLPSIAVTADGTRAAVAVAPAVPEGCWHVHLVDLVAASERELPGACAVTPAFSPDGLTLATASASGEILVWDVIAGSSRTLSPAVEQPYSLAFSPDGKTLAAGGDQVLVLFDPTGATSARRFGGLGAIIDELVFSPDGTHLVSGGGVARLWHVASGTSRGVSVADRVGFTPKGDVLAWGNVSAGIIADDLPRDRDGLVAWLTMLRYHVAGESRGVATN